MNKLQEALAARRAAAVQTGSKESDQIDYSQYASLIPEAEPIDDAAEEAERTIDELVERLGIVGAYKEFIKKMTPKVGNKKESIMISCPLPWHADKHPSAWMNSEKNTWNCAACNRGGDTYDLAAIGLGFDVDNYKTSQFRELRYAIAQHFGYEVFSTPGKSEVVYKPEKASNGSTSSKANGKKLEHHETETEHKEKPPLTKEQVDEALEIKIEQKLASSEVYSLNWKPIVTPGTFLDEYMRAATQDFNVEEFHFWNALIALGMAVGRNALVSDNPDVYGNLYVCLMGGSGSGKTKSRRYLDQILYHVLPYKEDMDYPDGVKEIPTPNSAEYLIKSFSKPVSGITAAGTSTIVDYAPVRGVVRFEELSSYKAIAGRTGSDLGSRMLEFYDAKERITTGSRQSGDTIAVKPFASAFTTTQPKSLSKILSRADEESGFLNRWLFVGGKTKPSKWLGGPKIDFSAAEKELFRVHAWATDQRVITFSKEAEWQANKDLNNFIIPDKDQHDPALGRIDLTIKKLCLLFAVNEMVEEISLDIYQRVMKIYNYIKAYSIFRMEYLDEITQKSENDYLVMNKIGELYKKNGEWPTAREIQRPLQRKINGTGELVRILEALVKINAIEEKTTRPKSGRPKVQYALIEMEGE